MLDLDKLEAKLDKALVNETPESLRSWIVNKRLKNFLQSFGAGTIEVVNGKMSQEVELADVTTPFEIKYQEISDSNGYLLAA